MATPTRAHRSARDAAQLPVTRAERLALVAISLAFVAVCAFWAVLTPIYEAPDEHAHLNSAIRLTQGPHWPDPGEARMFPEVLGAREEGDLPADDRSTFEMLDQPAHGSGVDQMTQHPPLYYAYGAAVLMALDYEDLRADQALLFLRLAGLVFAAPLPLLAWSTVRRITRRPRAGVVAAAALFAVPQLAQILGAVSNDGLTILLCSLVIWYAVRVMTGDERWSVFAGLGLSLGMGLLTKGNVLPFIVFTAVVLMVWPRHHGARRRLLQAFCVLAVAFVVGGWWWLRNILVYRSLQPNGLGHIHETKPWEPGTGPDIVQYVDLFWSRVSVRFWGEFGLLDYPLPELITDTLSVVTLAVILTYAFGRHPRRLEAVVLSLLPLIIVVTLIAHTWQYYVRTQMAGGMQGRYLYVAIVALIALSALAWMRFVRPEHHRAAGAGIVALSGGMAVLGPFRQYIGAYEGSQYRVTAAGLREWVTASPAQISGIVLAFCAAAAIGVVALVMTMRFLFDRSRTADRAVETEQSIPLPGRAATPAGSVAPEEGERDRANSDTLPLRRP